MEDRRKNILIVDDDEDFLIQTQIRVQSFGFNTITAHSQRQAEEVIKTTKPDLAIFDLMMENLDSGFVLSYHLKQRYPDVPVILATSVKSETGLGFSLNTEEERQWIKADVVLDKGIRTDQLEREIKRLLKL